MGAEKVAGTVEAWALLAGVLGRHAVAARAALSLHRDDAWARRIRMTVIVSSATIYSVRDGTRYHRELRKLVRCDGVRRGFLC